MMKKIIYATMLLLGLSVVGCQKEPEPIKVTSVALSASSLSLTEGETSMLSATISPSNAENKNVHWSTSNSDVATVSNGTVSAVKEGKATITVTTDDGGKTATCQVEVKSKTVAVESVTLDLTAAELTEGDELTLTAIVKPDNASNKSVEWSSSDEKVATVKDGKVTAVKAGTAKITVKTVDGGKTAECAVTVKEKVYSVESVSLDKTTAELTEGDELTLTATVKPDNASNKSVEWSSSDEKVATVKDGKVTAVKAGTAKITVKTVDGGKTAECAITVISNKYVEFKDANFKAYCVENFDTDGDGEINDIEALKITAINVSDRNISSLQGIEKFQNLEILQCDHNKLTYLDISQNTVLADLLCAANELASLDLSKNTALTKLTCANNRFTSLDLSKNTALTYLNCYGNRITSLDLSKNTALTTLECHLNELTSLDVSGCIALTTLICWSNGLTSLDVSRCTALTNLECNGNKLTSLDLSYCTALTDLACGSNLLTSLDVSKNTALHHLDCRNSNISTIFVWKGFDSRYYPFFYKDDTSSYVEVED